MEINIIKLKGALRMGTKMLQELGEFYYIFSFLFCLFVGRDSQVAWFAIMTFI